MTVTWGLLLIGSMLINLQENYAVRFASLRAFVRNLRRALRLGRRDFNVCFVDDRRMRELNAAFRGKDRPTDVLSFPWEVGGVKPAVEGHQGNLREAAGRTGRAAAVPSAEFEGFLGDVVISVDTARRNALEAGHATLNEIRWLILHGALHLLGYDHERDHGEMTRLELELRSRLAISGHSSVRRRRTC